MKHITFVTLVASTIAISAPAFADSKDVERHFAQDNEGIESVVILRSTPVNQRAADIFASLAQEGSSGIETHSSPPLGGVSISTKGGVNPVAQRIFDSLAAE